MKYLVIACSVALSCTLAVAAAAQSGLPTKEVLTLAVSEQIADAAAADARKSGARVVIAIVDDAGYPIVLKRLDGTQVASVQVAIDKARTAAIYRRPSRDFEEQVTSGRASAMELAGAAALTGGIPIKVNGKVVGAIGVSGETPKIDEDIAIVGAEFITEALASHASR